MFRREIFPFLSFKLLQRVKTLARDETEKDSQIQISADISRLWRNFYAETPWCGVLFELEGVQRPCLQRPLGARFSENKWRKMREKLGERRKIIFETRLLKMAGNDLLREPRYRVNWLWKSRLPISRGSERHASLDPWLVISKESDRDFAREIKTEKRGDEF